MIQTTGLTKRYASVTAVHNLTLALNPGEIFGFLGPNGAGKTTTMKMIAGLVKPTAGAIRVGAWDPITQPCEAKQIMGFIPDRPFLYGKLTGREFLSFIGKIYGIDPAHMNNRITRMIDLFEMQSYAGELIEGYSHGMKQRLVMSAALLHQPRVLIVDEPMVGLDPKGATLVKQIFRSLRNDGVTIFMSTHTLEIAEEMCDRIGIINEGALIAVGTMQQLRAATGGTADKLEAIFFRLTGEQTPYDVGSSLAER